MDKYKCRHEILKHLFEKKKLSEGSKFFISTRSEIVNLFGKNQNIVNDAVEFLLSDKYVEYNFYNIEEIGITEKGSIAYQNEEFLYNQINNNLSKHNLKNVKWMIKTYWITFSFSIIGVINMFYPIKRLWQLILTLI